MLHSGWQYIALPVFFILQNKIQHMTPIASVIGVMLSPAPVCLIQTADCTLHSGAGFQYINEVSKPLRIKSDSVNIFKCIMRTHIFYK